MKRQKPKDQPPEPKTLAQRFDALLDFAVTEGRTNWDGYYGHDNSFHMSSIRASEEYEHLKAILENMDNR